VARVLLTDGSSQIYRAFHAMARTAGRPLAAADGTPTGALLTFLQVLRKAMATHAPDMVAVAFDLPGPTFRHERLDSYKAKRQEMPEELEVQLHLAREALAAMGLRVVEVPGYEADDVIATLARQAREQGHEVVILSSDKDLLQLVRPGVVMHHALRDEVMDEAAVEAYFGVPPQRVADVLAIMGDASDNIPGVRGIGDKGATQLVQLYGDVETILASTSRIAQDERLGRLRKRLAQLLTEHAQDARLARELVALADDMTLPVTLPDLEPQPADTQACTTLFSRLGLRRFLDEYGQHRPETKALADVSTSGAVYATVDSPELLEALAGKLRAAGRFALDTETDGRDVHSARLVGIALSTAPLSGDYLPICHVAGTCLPLPLVREKLGPLLADPSLRKVGQNCKFDIEVLERHALPVKGVVMDTMIASYLLDSSRRSHDLDSLAEDHLGYRTITYAEVAGTGKDERTLDQVGIAEVTRYSGEDADVSLRLADTLAPRIEQAGLSRVFHEIEMPLVPVLASMELTGVRVDALVLSEISAELDKRLFELTHEIHRLAGHEFSIASPKQLATVLFDELGLVPRGRTVKTGARSTAFEVLEQLASEHPLAALVLEHRELSKLKGTYVDVLPTLVKNTTGRVHTSYNQSVAATGRLSSSDPNLQNIPIRTELGRRVRRAFVPAPGRLFVGADYSQVELRVMAHVSEDDTLCAAFAAGEDIHRTTAAQVFGVAPELVTTEMRTRAKEVNFGVLYGMTAHGLAQRLGCSRHVAQEIIERYFARLPRVKQTIERIIREVRDDPKHEARTLYGRARAFPDIVSRNQGQRQFAERASVNTVVQGTAADLIKLAMIDLHARLAEQSPESRLILQVHDELVVEAPEKDAERVKAIVVDAMENVEELRAPLRVAASVGASWYELK
jgi:DNA polymerase-1